MDASWVGRLRRDIQRELRVFDDGFARTEGRRHLPCYVGGQVRDLKRKSVEAIADEAGVPQRTLLVHAPPAWPMPRNRRGGGKRWWSVTRRCRGSVGRGGCWRRGQAEGDGACGGAFSGGASEVAGFRDRY